MNANSQPVNLELVPHRHLQREPDGVWRATGNDPGFECGFQAPLLAAGWYMVEIEVEQISGPAMCAYLYPDYGDHNHEAHRIFLSCIRKGRVVHRGIVMFTQQVRALRFDPSISPCEFRLGAMRLFRISRLDAARSMLSDVLGRSESRFATLACLSSAGLRGGLRGLGDALYRIYACQPNVSFSAPYQTWLDLYDHWPVQEVERAAERGRAVADANGPLFSIVLPVYNAPERWLVKAIESVRAQSYPKWELCIANDASPSPHVRRVLDRYARADSRIKVVHREQNGHISRCSNSAAELATGDWLALLDHDDELHPMALLEVADAIAVQPQWRVLFSDEDKIDGDGRRFDPYMKSDWNYDLFLSHNCISHLGIYHTDLFREIGGFNVGMEGSQDWDLALRAIERLGTDQIGHIPKVLYHWRAIEGSTALAPQEKDYAHDAGMRAIQAHLDRLGRGANVENIPGQRGNYRVRYPVPEPVPLVSIIVPTRDRVGLLRACIDSVLEVSTYRNFEIIVVDNQSSELETLAYLERLRAGKCTRVLAVDEPFNYARINNAAAEIAAGEVLCFLNNDITVISPDWLEEMVSQACRADVGAVGAMLYYPNDTIQHAGVAVGVHGVAAHVYSGHGRGFPGHMSRARLAQSLSAVTAACLVVQKAHFDAVGGFDTALGVAFNDVDLCLRLDAQGKRNIWTPFAELYHHESASRGLEDSPEKKARFRTEIEFMERRWGERLRNDPYYSPSFTLDEEPCQLAFPPRWSWSSRVPD